MVEHVTGGNRRIDRVMADGFLESLRTVDMTALRALRADAEQEEVDLSYLRRMVQGRIDILTAESRRRGGDGGSIVDQLASILSDDGPRSPARGLGRHSTVEPSRTDSHRRHLEAVVADVEMSDVSGHSDEKLQELLAALTQEEQRVSTVRREVQQRLDACQAEITRRYRDGEADVASLLDGHTPA